MIVEIEGRDQERLGRSTDFADSLVLTFASTAAGASGQYRRKKRGRRRNVGGVV
jgi:hypothetical protein